MSLSNFVPDSLRGASLRQHVAAHPLTASGLAISCLAILLLFFAGLHDVLSGDDSTTMRYALWGGFAGFALTTAGAVPGFFLRTLPQKIEDSLLGLAAGMMLAASSFSLILPGLKAGDAIAVKNAEHSRAAAGAFMENAESRGIVPWLTLDKSKFEGRINHIPTRDEIAPTVNEQLIVELYSK